MSLRKAQGFIGQREMFHKETMKAVLTSIWR